jgi:hypothetical protein
LLDEISKLRFEGKLHKSVLGERQNELIKSFRDWKGMEYILQAMHKAIRWNYRDPLNELEVEDLLWRIVQGASNNNKLENGLTKVVHVPKKSMFIPA